MGPNAFEKLRVISSLPICREEIAAQN